MSVSTAIGKTLESQKSTSISKANRISFVLLFKGVKERQVETSRIFSGAAGQARRNDHWGVIKGSPCVELIPRRS